MTALAITPPIVIYGAARSGTTYLVQILNQHPGIYVSDETRVFVWAHEILSRLAADQRSGGRTQDEPGGRRVADRLTLVSYLRRVLPEGIRAYYRELAPDALWWGDKYPHYADPRHAGCLETILELFPRARFLHIVRDGRDVVTSGLRGTWRDFDSVHRMWTSHLDIGCSFGRALPADRYFELRYEDLVRDDLAMARRIFDFLEIELHDDVAEFCRAQRSCRTRFCTPTRDIRADVLKSDWADYLSPARRLESLELLGEHLVRLGYETRDSLEGARHRFGGSVETHGAAASIR